MNQIKETIKSLHKDGLSYAEIGRRTGYGRSYIQKVAHGYKPGSLKLLMALEENLRDLKKLA